MTSTELQPVSLSVGPRVAIFERISRFLALRFLLPNFPLRQNPFNGKCKLGNNRYKMDSILTWPCVLHRNAGCHYHIP